MRKKMLLISLVLLAVIFGLNFQEESRELLSEETPILAEEEKGIGGSNALFSFETAIVVRVIDGDTVVVRLSDSSEEHIRIIGIDAPEDTRQVEEFGSKATAYLRKLLPYGSTVYLTMEGENRSFQRLRRHIWLSEPSKDELHDSLVGARMLAVGLAEAVPRFTPLF